MPPVKMTRAEYEAKYGVKPFTSTSTLDTTPAPVRMTRAEYEMTYGVPPTGATQKPKAGLLPRIFGDIPSDIKETAQGFVGAARRGAQNIQEAVTKEGISLPQRVVGATVAAPSAVVNMAGEVAIGAGKLLTTDEFEKAITAKIGEGVQNVADTKLGKSLTSLYNQLPESEKYTLSKIIAPIANVATSVPVTRGVSVAAESATRTVPEVANKIKSFSENVKVRGDEKALQGVVDAIAKVEDKYSPLRKANKFSKDVNASRTRIAQSGVLEKAVDNNGKINGELAAKIYKQENLDGTEGIVRKELEKEGLTVTPQEVREALELAIMDSGLEAADLTAALNSIDRHIEGLSKRADELGNIPLYKIQDAKIAETNNINYLTPPEAQKLRKSLAKAYREMIENQSRIELDVDGEKVGVGRINQELAKLLSDVERLQALDGRIVDKGKLGKYTASLVGTGIGMAAGSVGGGFGAAAGGVLGGEVASGIVSRGMQSTFKGGGKGLPPNKVIEAAKKGAGVNLKVPDKPLVAPKNVPKTKEIKKIEGQIKKNVTLQEKAIKAGDFALVAKLKEIYQVLVEKLKEQVRFVRENIKSESGKLDLFGKGDGQSIPLQRNQRNTTTPAKTNSISKTIEPDTQTVKADVEDSMVTENLMRLEITDVKKQEDINLLLSLQRKAEKGPLSDDDLVDAQRIVEDSQGKLPDAEVTPQTTALNPKNFRTADEFVKAQGTPVYHGSGSNLSEIKSMRQLRQNGSDVEPSNLGGNSPFVHVTDSEELAKGYARSRALNIKGRPNVIEAIIQGKILDLNTITKQEAQKIEDALQRLSGGKGADARITRDRLLEKQVTFSDIEQSKYLDSVLRENGYSGIKFRDRGFVGEFKDTTAVLPDKIKTRTQLEDIWKQANKTSSTLLEEAKKYKSAEEFVQNIKAGGELRSQGIGEGLPLIAKWGWKPMSDSSDTIKLYRAINPKYRDIVEGDFLAGSKRRASGFGGEVVEVELPQNQLIKSGDDTYIFWTGQKQKELERIWAQAQKS